MSSAADYIIPLVHPPATEDELRVLRREDKVPEQSDLIYLQEARRHRNVLSLTHSLTRVSQARKTFTGKGQNVFPAFVYLPGAP